MELTQSAGSIRSNQGVERMKQILEMSGSDRGFSVVYSKSFKNLRSNMSYLLPAARYISLLLGILKTLSMPCLTIYGW